MEIRGSDLFLGGVRASDLAERFGTPLYVMEEAVIRERFRNLAGAIRYPKLRIHYACKANTNISVLRVLMEEGSYIDAVSPGEIFLALEAGFAPDRILFTGNNVTDREMLYALGRGVPINVDSLSQLRRYGKLNPGGTASVRINPDIGAGHHDHTITGGPRSKFGIYFDQVDRIKEIAREFRLKIRGVHMHIGSGILDPEPFLLGMRTLLKTAEEFDDLEFVDFGGGIGVPYRPEEKPLNLEDFGGRVGELFGEWCRGYGKDLILAVEPGRYLVAEAGTLLARVNTVKITPHRRFVGTDSGFNHLVRPTMYGSYHPILVANKANEANTVATDVCGNICESGDLFARDRMLPEIEEGDLIAILNAGAYGFSMASNYNSRPRPAEVMVDGGRPRLIRERETLEDLLRGQVL
ncbi:MAG: diaminopimelate decarboxylase [bacterium]